METLYLAAAIAAFAIFAGMMIWASAQTEKKHPIIK